MITTNRHHESVSDFGRMLLAVDERIQAIELSWEYARPWRQTTGFPFGKWPPGTASRFASPRRRTAGPDPASGSGRSRAGSGPTAGARLRS
jgi:hypothetical protein